MQWRPGASSRVRGAASARADRGDSGIAAWLNSVLRRVGGGIGGQVAAVLLAALAVAGGPSRHSFAAAFWTCAGVGAAARLLALGIRRNES